MLEHPDRFAWIEVEADAAGKSVIVVEHHQAVMAHADWIIDLGPGAGHDGGRIVFEGTPAGLVVARSTLTGQHLAAYAGTSASTVDRRSS
jgi:excinuclease UvrABC ATPase subunit